MDGSSPATAAAPPAATQRSCWRSTPTEDRNCRTSETSAATALAACNPKPASNSTVATVPAGPARANGLAIEVSSSRPGRRLPAASTMPAPVTAVTTTTRQPGERSRPPGSSRNGRVMPNATPGAHRKLPATAVSCAANGSGRPSPTSWSTQGSKGTISDQARPEIAYSQPIGLAGRRTLKTSPIVA
jgi:hypothetical protein